jgi:hypothetical protein
MIAIGAHSRSRRPLHNNHPVLIFILSGALLMRSVGARYDPPITLALGRGSSARRASKPDNVIVLLFYLSSCLVFEIQSKKSRKAGAYV